MNKQDIISSIFYDPAGYGNAKETLEEAKAKDPTITMDDVKQWRQSNVEQKTKPRGFNSFVASKPFAEFQIDLLFFSDLKDPIYEGGLLCVDSFSKYCTVIPLKSKTVPDVIDAFKKAFSEHKMGGKPETIYSDNEGAFNSKDFIKYINDNNIKHIITLGHAPIAERTIRTIKKMIYDRHEVTKQPWHELLFQVLLKYNVRMVHHSTHFTPVDAMKEKNYFNVKLNLELKAKHNRMYPEIVVGDKVKLFKKKDKLDKERVSNWTKDAYTVESITETHGQSFYKVVGREKHLLRHEILLIH